MDKLMIAYDFLIRLFRDMPGTLESLSHAMGPWFYIVLFLIIFCETGLVVTPFLPGDSLLFAAGAVAALPGSGINIPLLAIILLLAAIIGDALNYAISHWATRKYLGKVPFVKEEHVKRTAEFFEKHGGKTIVFARFLPIIRTYAPFVAGAASMPRVRFTVYNVLGAILWIPLFLGLGVFFGNQPAVRANFQYVILAIIVISVIPAVVEFIRSRSRVVSDS